MPIQPAAVELLAALASIIERWGRWYLFGAQAVIAHGVPRLSADVDVTLEMTPHEPADFAGEMSKAGFDLIVNDPEFVSRTRVMPFVHRATAMPLDVVLAGSGLEKEFLDRARRVDLGGVTIPLIDLDDLMIAKILAGRPKDIEDARALWRARAVDIDSARIRRILRLLEEALGQSDLTPALESIIKS
jgi:Nucleotidyl transferase of unknown function (DUF2204)